MISMHFQKQAIKYSDHYIQLFGNCKPTFYDLKLVFARMVVVFDIRAAWQRANYPEVKHLRLTSYDSWHTISNVEVKSIGSAE